MAIVACPNCGLRYTVGAPRPGMGLRCRCGQVFDPEPQLPAHTAQWTVFNQIAVDPEPPHAEYIHYARPSPIIFATQPGPSLWPALMIIGIVGTLFAIAGLSVMANRSRQIAQPSLTTRVEPAATAVKEKPPVAIHEPPPPIIRRDNPPKSQPADPFDQLANEVDAVTPGLIWSLRLDGISGRMVRNAKNQTAVVVSSDDPKATERSARAGMKSGDDVYIRGRFIFIGDKQLLDSIRNPPTTPRF